VERHKIGDEVPPEALEQAVRVLRGGGVIVFPAERLYGLGADAANARAVERIFELKGRGPKAPLPVLAADLAQVREWVHLPEEARPLIERFWPGPLTVVLEAQKALPELVTGGSGRVGIRVPGNGLARQLCRALGSLLTATSANLSGRPAARTADEAGAGLAGEVDLILDAGALAGEPGSTVIAIEGGLLTVLRPGVISVDELLTSWKGKIV
jgi:L-threonylcarbamoyladenylate synthase